MRNERGKSIGYGFSIMGMLFLVAAAFFMPRLVLGIQDKKYMEETYFDTRNGLDYAAVNTNYEIDLHQRLSNFAKGYQEGRRYFAVASDHTMEVPEINWKQLRNDGFFVYFFDSYGVQIGNMELTDIKVEDSEFYAIYDEETVNGAVLMCWQFKLRIGKAFQAKVIIDAKDKTIYSFELQNELLTDYMSVVKEKNNAEIYDSTWYRFLYFQEYFNSDVFEYDFDIIPMESGYYVSILYDGNPLTLQMDYLNDEGRTKGISAGINEIVQLIPAME